MKLTRMLACLLCVLLLGGCATETAAVEETVVPETQAGSGDPAQSTCKSSYTGQPDPEAVVAVCAGRELTAAQLQAWYWAEITHFCQQEPETVPDFALPLESQSCGLEDGCTWQQYFLKQALNRWHSAAALMEQAEQEGRPLEAAYMPDRDKYAEYMEGMPATKFLYGYSESYQPNTMHQRYLDQIPELLDTLAREQGYSGVEAMAEDGFGTSAQALEDFVYQYNYAYMFFTTLSYDVEPEEGAVESWLAEHAGSYSQTGTLVDIRHILLVPDASEDMEKAWTDCERQAQKLLTQWKRELWVTEATFAELATEHSQDTGTAADGGLYRRIHPGQLLPELDSWCFGESRQEGDTAIFRSEAGCHIVYFAGRVEAAYEAAEDGGRFPCYPVPRYECYGCRVPADYDGPVPEQMLLRDVPEGEYIVFEHGPFDYEQENRSVEFAIDEAWDAFDWSSSEYEFDPTPGRMYYFYHDPSRFWKELWPVRRKNS